jgi:transcriptional regulator with XRE-family HTH domain
VSGGGEDGPEFGAWLRSWRHRARVTQEGLAEDLGYDVSYIRKIESGTRRASRQFRARLSQLVGEPEEALVGVALSDVARPLLPQPVDRLVGREQMAADLVRLLSGPARCVTLTGPPGIGKSR